MTRRSRDLFRLNDSANSNKDSPFENSTRLKSRPIKNVKYSITSPKSQSETSIIRDFGIPKTLGRLMMAVGQS